MLTAINLTKQVTTGDSELTILDDISFSLDEGKSMAILGESGSGKTTLLGLLAGLDTPTTGEVKLKDTSIFNLSEEERAQLRKENLGFVFQSFQLIAGLTALENVMMPLELKGDKEARAKAEEMLEKVGLAGRLNHFANQLSGGEQQRVAIARAFVTKPKLLLADEPTGNLDTATGEKIVKLMFSLNEALNTTLVLVTHDTHLAAMCNESITLSGGKIIQQNTHQPQVEEAYA
ncbi:ABC transporter ATP-binding protein [Aliikangiella marina]|uniref:ABC transporter ATP-binding protein n=1 Tax=Aliikangiella marina TaxID=1712262 RepID=A0A545TEE8_9GAMM|nr:ABC transporter ATP-binding protein [Aliikangiella marina]TQV75597.1 ABC transporter ATP-binding protein [Aliikangiella marina]